MHRKHIWPLIALIVAFTLLPPAVLAQDGVPVPAPGGQSARLDPPPVQPDTALGAAASVGCGFFVRVTIVTGGTQVGTIVGAVACCGFMVFDAFVLEPR